MSFDRRGFYREVGLRLAAQRKDRRATQEQVANAIGIPRATYASIEGGRQRITVDILWRAAVVLDCPLAALVPEPILGAAATLSASEDHDTHVSAAIANRAVDDAVEPRDTDWLTASST